MVSPISALTGAINRYVVEPSNAFGLGGFIFDIEGETTINLKSEITDHFLEDNSTIQDHIAIKPKKITLNTYVGELVYKPESDELLNVETVVRKLTTLNAYLPELTDTAQSLINLASDDNTSITDTLENITSQTVNKATDYYAVVRNLLNTGSKQQGAYLYFKSLMEQKILVSLQTPFEYMNNMAIESVTAYQGEESNTISNFTITLKQIRLAEVLTVAEGTLTFDYDQETGDEYQGRAATQLDDFGSNGSISGVEAPIIPDTLPPVVGAGGGLIDPVEIARIVSEAQDELRNLSNPDSTQGIDLGQTGVVQ
tara:strand:+ start:5017 stop:5952 length:936 start_codon:yes stop_codon:yes gene_type:complete